MVAKKKPPVGGYIAMTGLNNERTGRRFEAGDLVQSGDFPPETLEHWVKRGVLAPTTDTMVGAPTIVDEPDPQEVGDDRQG